MCVACFAFDWLDSKCSVGIQGNFVLKDFAAGAAWSLISLRVWALEMRHARIFFFPWISADCFTVYPSLHRLSKPLRWTGIDAFFLNRPELLIAAVENNHLCFESVSRLCNFSGYDNPTESNWKDFAHPQIATRATTLKPANRTWGGTMSQW